MGDDARGREKGRGRERERYFIEQEDGSRGSGVQRTSLWVINVALVLLPVTLDAQVRSHAKVRGNSMTGRKKEGRGKLRGESL